MHLDFLWCQECFSINSISTVKACTNNLGFWLIYSLLWYSWIISSFSDWYLRWLNFFRLRNRCWSRNWTFLIIVLNFLSYILSNITLFCLMPLVKRKTLIINSSWMNINWSSFRVYIDIEVRKMLVWWAINFYFFP